MNIGVLFLLAVMSASAQTNAVHTWTMKSGVTFTGDYFTSGAQAVAIKVHGTNCLLKIADLTTNDWLYFQDCKFAQRQRQLNAEAGQMQSAGLIEFTGKYIDNFPEKTYERNGWLDATFEGLDPDYVYAQMELGFDVEDKNGDFINKCYVEKVFPPTQVMSPDEIQNLPPSPLLPEVLNLKKGDKVRLIGKVVEGSFYSQHVLFHVQKVEMIQTAAETAKIEVVRQQN